MKYKVKNDNDFDIGLELSGNGLGIRGINIAPHSFASLDEDEIAFQDSKCTLFSSGKLTVDKSIAENLNMNTENPNIVTDERIEEILKEAITKMKKDLSEITEPFAKDKVFKAAKKSYDTLTGSKIDFIAEFCGRDIEELKPDKVETK